MIIKNKLKAGKIHLIHSGKNKYAVNAIIGDVYIIYFFHFSFKNKPDNFENIEIKLTISQLYPPYQKAIEIQKSNVEIIQ